MDDPQVYLEKLSAFSRMLRLEGLSVSPRETGDASQILIALGIRELTPDALRQTAGFVLKNSEDFDVLEESQHHEHHDCSCGGHCGGHHHG